MYEQLIKRLRNVSTEFEQLNHVSVLLLEAADAIEGLSHAVDQMTEWRKNPWIPVTERLPEDGKFVLVCNDDGHMMIAKHETETYEWYYKYTNYDFDIWDNKEQGPVCYWTPLLEPPKEE